MVALKEDPVWTRISRFGQPWPPFDFNSGMGVEDVSHDELRRVFGDQIRHEGGTIRWRQSGRRSRPVGRLRWRSGRRARA